MNAMGRPPRMSDVAKLAGVGDPFFAICAQTVSIVAKSMHTPSSLPLQTKIQILSTTKPAGCFAARSTVS